MSLPGRFLPVRRITAGSGVVVPPLTFVMASGITVGDSNSISAQAGDLIVAFAGNVSGEETAEGSGYTTILNSTEGSRRIRLQFRIATSSMSSTGSFAGATRCGAAVYRGWDAAHFVPGESEWSVISNGPDAQMPAVAGDFTDALCLQGMIFGASINITGGTGDLIERIFHNNRGYLYEAPDLQARTITSSSWHGGGTTFSGAIRYGAG